MDDTLADFNPATSHLFICLKNEGSEMPCNRECLHRLMDVAGRQARVLRGEPCPTCTVGPSRQTVGMVCQTCGRDYGVSGNPPECADHHETQHRDRNPPWCSRCGWTRGRPAIAARKCGESSAEREGTHRPWSPTHGYRTSMGDEGDVSFNERPSPGCSHENVKHRLCLDCGQALT